MICVYPVTKIEDECEDYTVYATATFGDYTPKINQSEWVSVYDEILGYGFKAEHQNGYLSFLMPFKKYV